MDKRRSNATRGAEIRGVIENERGNVFSVKETISNDDDGSGECGSWEDCLFDIINEMYGYIEPVCEIYDDGTAAPALHGVVNMTEEVVTLRSLRGQKKYFEMEPIHVGTATGVEIKYISHIHHWGRETYISCASALADAEAEIWTDAAGSDAGCGAETIGSLSATVGESSCILDREGRRTEYGEGQE